MEMIGSATTSAMEGAAAAGSGVGAMGASAMESAQPYIDRAKANPVQFGAGIAAMGSNIYLFGDTVASGTMGLLNFLQDVPLTRWVGATSIIATYLAMRGTGNIDDDRAVIVANKDALVRIIKAAPADVIVATHTTPAKIKAVQTNIKTYYMEAQTRGLLAAQGITGTAEEGLEGAQIGKAAANQGIALNKASASQRNKASTKIGRMVRDRKAKQAAAAEATRKIKRGEIVEGKRGKIIEGKSAGASAGSGQPSLTSYGFGAGAKGGKRNTKKRSNKKKKTKKHKKKQHRKTKRG